MVKLGSKSEGGPSTRQKVVTKCLWLLGTCRNAIVVVATGVLGYWFAAQEDVPVRLMGTYLPPCTVPPHPAPQPLHPHATNIFSVLRSLQPIM